MSSIQLAPVHTRLLATWTVLAADAVAHSHTGDLLAVDFVTVTLPANSLGANGILRVSSAWTYPASANLKTMIIKFGGSLITSLTTGTSNVFSQVSTFVRNRNNTGIQAGQALQFAGNGAANNSPPALAINTTVAQPIVLGGQLANASESITLESWAIEVFYQA